MALDAFKNFAVATVSTGYAAGTTSIVLTTGQGGRMPAGATNYTWWNATDYANPVDDPNVEIVRGTIASDTITVSARGQEGTTDVNHNTAGKTYKILATITAKSLTTDLAATYQPLDATLSAFAAFNTAGLLTQTAADTFTGRTLLGTADQVTVTNGDGIAGHPTLSLPAYIEVDTLYTTGYLGIYTGYANGGVDLFQDAAGQFSLDNGRSSGVSGGSLQHEPAMKQWRLYPSNHLGYLLLENTVASGGTDFTDFTLTLFGDVGTGAVANYFSTQINFAGHEGATANTAYAIIVDGSLSATVFGSNTKWFVWDHVNGKNLLLHSQADNDALVFFDDTAGNLKLGGTAVRATTEGTNHIDIFNGTAPVGTLSNGVSLYSVGGELWVRDAAGDATRLS